MSNPSPNAKQPNHSENDLADMVNRSRAMYHEGGLRYQPPIVGSRQQCNFFVCDNPQSDSGTVFLASLREAKSTENNKEMCVHVASMISLVVPHLKDTLVRTLEQRGISVNEVPLPSDAANFNIDVKGSIDYPSILVVFGCYVILLFMKPCFDTYPEFMGHRIREMSVEVGRDPAAPSLDIPISMAKIEAIKAILGSSLELKEAIVQFVVAMNYDRNDNIGSLCKYLLGFMSWRDMEAYRIFDEITEDLEYESSRMI